MRNGTARTRRFRLRSCPPHRPRLCGSWSSGSATSPVSANNRSPTQCGSSAVGISSPSSRVVAGIHKSVAHTLTLNSRARKIELIALPQPRSSTFIPGSMGMISVSASVSPRAFGPSGSQRPSSGRSCSSERSEGVESRSSGELHQLAIRVHRDAPAPRSAPPRQNATGVGASVNKAALLRPDCVRTAGCLARHRARYASAREKTPTTVTR